MTIPDEGLPPSRRRNRALPRAANPWSLLLMALSLLISMVAMYRLL